MDCEMTNDNSSEAERAYEFWEHTEAYNSNASFKDAWFAALKWRDANPQAAKGDAYSVSKKPYAGNIRTYSWSELTGRTDDQEMVGVHFVKLANYKELASENARLKEQNLSCFQKTVKVDAKCERYKEAIEKLKKAMLKLSVERMKETERPQSGDRW
jgi:hypothetical protein